MGPPLPSWLAAPTRKHQDINYRHHDAFHLASRLMRTTLTLDDDIAARLQDEVRRTGQPFKTVVNELLRTGLAQCTAAKNVEPFKVEPFSSKITPGLSLDSISTLLEEVEGPWHR